MSKSVKARVLTDGPFGKAGDVVSVDESIAGHEPDLDPHPDAVAYAEKIIKARKAAAEAAVAE
jgi:hypothetical protein